MKKRLLLILALGVSIAPPAFSVEMGDQPLTTGEISKTSMYDPRSIKCEYAEEIANLKKDGAQETGSAPTQTRSVYRGRSTAGGAN